MRFVDTHCDKSQQDKSTKSFDYNILIDLRRCTMSHEIAVENLC